MKLSKIQQQNLKKIGLQLKPIVYINGFPLSENVILETERALNDHELIKIKLQNEQREIRQQQLAELAKITKAIIIQQIGKVAVIYRHNTQPKSHLSNVTRFQ